MYYGKITAAVGILVFNVAITRAADSHDVSSATPLMPVTVLNSVSKSFRQQTTAAIQTIPQPVQQLIGTAGWRIQLSEFVVDAQPELARDRPRGWPAYATWQNTDAVHFPVERLLVLAEKRRNSQGRIVETSRIGGVLRHELGHAFDMALGMPGLFRSSSEEFERAYTKDVDHIRAENGKELDYYLQRANAGRQEAFAEAFGIILGGGSDVTREQQFRASFPHVLQFVQHELEACTRNASR